MITLSEVMEKTGLKYRTIVKYVNMGIIPKPAQIYGQRRGSESVYRDEVVDIINRVKIMQKRGIPLQKIADQMRRELDDIRILNPTVDYLIPLSEDAWQDFRNAHEHLDAWLEQQIEEQMPGYKLYSLETQRITIEGKQYLKPIEIKVEPKSSKEVSEDANE